MVAATSIDRTQSRSTAARREGDGAVGGKLVGQGVADPAVAADLERSQLLEVAGDGRLGHFEAETGETRGDLFLARERMLADQVRNRPMAPFL